MRQGGIGQGGDWPGTQRLQPTPGTMASGARIPGPRRDFIEAFDGSGRPGAVDPYASVTAWPEGAHADGAPVVVPGTRRDGGQGDGGQRESGPSADDGHGADAGGDGGGDRAVGSEPARPGHGRATRAPAARPRNGGKGRTFTGIAAAAVTTVLAVVVAGQVTADAGKKPAAPATGQDRGDEDGSVSRSDDRRDRAPAPAEVRKAVPATYEQLMATRFPIDPELTADGSFEVVPGFARAPGKGTRIPYRVDIEKGLGMDGALFAEAVQRTLNDNRSWANNGAQTFERISSGEPKFVITLASPGTTHIWCEKSGLNTADDNVSCDSAATDRVMVNAFRWAQGSETYGPKAMYAYRQMLINHEVGHRLGHGHVNCRTEGEPAPVMQQQTKSLDIDGVTCLPNPWAYPGR
ncbi:DUF3152 domain-containing protein [Streptomyces sp. NPDC055078]